jgi:uncharacterized protein (DUF433 family)
MQANDIGRYEVLETDIGPMISESRVSVFDVMDAHDAGDSIYEISATFNLTPLQVETALAYIEQNRSFLEPQLATIQRALAEREALYRTKTAEIDKRIATEPLTPARRRLLQLRESSPERYGENQDAGRPE